MKSRSWRVALGALLVAAMIAAGLIAAARSGSTRNSAPLASGGVRALAHSGIARPRASERKTTGTFGPHVVTGHFDGLSVAVRDLPDAPAGPRTPRKTENEVSNPDNQGVTARDPVVQATAGDAPAPNTSVSFRGICDLATTAGCPANLAATGCNGCLPPDTNGEVGPTQYVQMVNVNFAVFDKAGNVLKSATDINLLWPSGPCRDNNDGDPVVLYDQLAGRWVLTQFIAGAPYGECIAVSQTGDATGSYYLYTFPTDGVVGSSGTFYDYPHLGVWPDAYYMAANEFPPGFQLSQGYGAFAFERQKMILGDPTAKMIFFDVGQSSPPGSTFYAGALPSDLDGSNPPPAGTPNFFVEVDDPATLPSPPTGSAGFNMRIWKFHVDFATPANSTFGNSGNPNYILPVALFSRIPCVYGLPNVNCVPQKLGAEGLDALNDRLMFRLAYRNFGPSPPSGIPANTEALVVNGTVNVPDTTDPSKSVAAVRWYEVRNPNGNGPANPVVYQQGTYAPNSDPAHVLWRWMASVAQDHVGNMAVGFSAAGPNDFPDIRYAGRLRSSPLNVLDQTEKTVPGPTYSGPQTNIEGRWGDYSDMTVDPVDDCTFWYTTEFIMDDLVVLGDWQTWIAAFKFPNCPSGTTAVATKSFTSRWTKGGVAVTWRTSSEVDLLGFNVWRSSGKSWRKVNPALVRAKHSGGPQGATYRLVDRTAKAGRFYNYRLQTVDLRGKRSWYGVGSVPTR